MAFLGGLFGSGAPASGITPQQAQVVAQNTGQWQPNFWDKLGALVAPSIGENLMQERIQHAQLAAAQRNAAMVASDPEFFGLPGPKSTPASTFAANAPAADSLSKQMAGAGMTPASVAPPPQAAGNAPISTGGGARNMFTDANGQLLDQPALAARGMGWNIVGLPGADKFLDYAKMATPDYQVSGGQRFNSHTGKVLPGVVGQSVQLTPSGLPYNSLDISSVPQGGGLGAPPVPGYVPQYDPSTGRFAGWVDPGQTVQGALSAKAQSEATAQAQNRGVTLPDGKGGGTYTSEYAATHPNAGVGNPTLGPPGAKLGSGFRPAGAPVAGPGGIPVGQTTFSKAQAEADGANEAKAFQTLKDTAADANKTIPALQNVDKLLQGVDGNGFSTSSLALSNAARGLGINLDPKLDNKTAAQALIQNLVMHTPRAPGAQSDAELKNRMAQVPQLDNSAGSRKIIIHNAITDNLRDAKLADLATAWRAKAPNGSLNDTINGETFQGASQKYMSKYLPYDFTGLRK